MPTLTEAEIARVRMRSGDNCGPDYEVSDAEMQILYDDIPNLSCGCANDIDTLTALVIDVRWAKASNLFDEDGDGGTRNVSQRFNQLEKMRDEWFKKCGMSGGLITTSTLDLGLDRSDPATEYAALDDETEWGYFA
jgi:hypothetical protein